MKVATWNIHRGRGTAGPFRPNRIAEVIAEIRPDLIALQEAQHYLRRGTPMLDAARIEDETGLRPLPVVQRPDHQGWRSNLLLARRGARLLRGPIGLKLGGWEPRGAILAELDLGSGPLRVIAAHLSLGPERRRRQAEMLLQAARGDGSSLPVLLMGDLNEWREGASALGVLARRFAMPPPLRSFPAFRPIWALDHILADPAAMLRQVAVHDTRLARRASDHLPLTARLEMDAA
ncbi:endonuclease/exonuclease/phosphatase family protein [Teichococcus oryzae]|uniref:endonuclease/exonuclease/phosphatase family protein n=1 Tax=Teichococcus oryzae TaxID=1608942 RepID=UPI0013760C51|nr:endonuclease/exonuclease/phosphatase family protein [Pseudoroseomonas oryzae]